MINHGNVLSLSQVHLFIAKFKLVAGENTSEIDEQCFHFKVVYERPSHIASNKCEVMIITTIFASLNVHQTCGNLRSHSETARAMDVASNTTIGLMRLLWWQEAIDNISKKLIEHPIAQALTSVISEHKISKSWLKQSVEARINDAKREVTDIRQWKSWRDMLKIPCQPFYTQHSKQVVLNLPRQVMLHHILARQVVLFCFLNLCHTMPPEIVIYPLR